MTDFTQLPPQLYTDIAMGLKPSAEVFIDHGYTADDYMKASTMAWFRRACEAAKARLESEGFTFKNKMSALAEDLLVDAWRAAKVTTNLEDKLDVAKYLSKVAGLEPVNGQVGAGGGGFSVTINIPSPTGKTEPLTITATTEAELSAPPAHIAVLENRNEDLSGLPV